MRLFTLNTRQHQHKNVLAVDNNVACCMHSKSNSISIHINNGIIHNRIFVVEYLLFFVLTYDLSTPTAFIHFRGESDRRKNADMATHTRSHLNNIIYRLRRADREQVSRPNIRIRVDENCC